MTSLIAKTPKKHKNSQAW